MLLRLQRYNLRVVYKPGSQMYLADHLSRAPLPVIEEFQSEFEVFAVEVESINPLESIKVSPDRLNQIQKATGQDLILETLKSTVLQGWPETKDEVPQNIREYWNFREEITLYNGILLKNQRVIIPKAMRPEILSRIHSSHQGITSCIRKARDVVFWPNMSSDIKEIVDRCPVCAENQPQNNFIEVDELVDSTISAEVIKALKQQFSRHGIPDTLVTDNGPQFDCKEFQQFAKEWEFEHLSSSPYHAISNGKAESAVKVVKQLFKKSNDPFMALLNYRNTPTEGLDTSPTQRLMSRRTRTLLSTVSSLLNPEVPRDVKRKIEKKRQKAKLYYDQKVKVLPQIEVVRRNRQALKMSNPERNQVNNSETSSSDDAPPVVNPLKQENQEIRKPEPQKTRTRDVKLPAKFKDFVM
ncbi:uncharacterized protein K02A2.6 [Exaiptasia diaphana]|uniref:Integrase catalytic domain-containing protein n=1 Tax=Exaiptasia diaphana TaxID=2652724 RepID=A0A913YZ61_EXADI|nr:uncharacterized protein K02A2.6 [Exaiptasia diaphana]